ncbi:MAG: hypothetical protein HYT39_03935 [Candidatus Sungbacteria bacterium]|nr:hypothetical protein [Candidatus Sungbacteria bacterium]
MKYKKGLILGFVGGILFAVAHLYLNMRYDLPFWLILVGLEKIVSCIGRGCWWYVGGAGGLSAVIWALIGAAIQKYIQSSEKSIAEE